MINLGTSTMQDFALGDNLVERIDLGDTTIFDPYTTITGTIPLTFNSRVAGALKDYRLYGTSAGSGTPTESGEPAGFKIPILNTSGNLFTEEGSGLIQVDVAGNKHFGKSLGKLPAGGYDLSYVRSGRVDLFVTIKGNGGTYRVSENNPTAFTVLSTDDEVIIRTSYASNDRTWAELGFTNIVVDQQSNYDLFIGSTKLGEEEYLDYQEQKVYKRTENLFNKDAKDVDNGYVEKRFLISDGTTGASDNSFISEYIEVSPSTIYALKVMSVSYSPSVCEYGSDKSYLTGTAYNARESFTLTTSANTKYIRISVRVPSIDDISVTKGSTVPSSYIPYLQPTDPPVPLPPIPTYKGENTLSSTETLGEATVKGRISAISP